MRLHVVQPTGIPILVFVLALLLNIGASGCFTDDSVSPADPTGLTPGGDPTDDGSPGASTDDDDTVGDSNDGTDGNDDTVDNGDGDGNDTPPPPPIGDTGLAGGRPLAGFWNNWVGRHPMGDKFQDHGSYGTMGNNTVAGVKMDVGARGWFECDIYYDTEIHPGVGGGQHLIGVFSQAAARSGPYDPNFVNQELDGWLRLDIAVREDRVQGVIYQDSSSRRTFATGTYPFVAWKEWATLRVEWEQRDDEVELTINGRTSTHAIERGLNPIGNILMIGNMDRNTGSRCVGDDDPCGTLGKIRYRNFSWGN